MSGELLAFLRAARRHLWLEVLLRRLHPALWMAGAVLLVGGIANLTFYPVPWPGAASAAAVAALVVVLPALWERPRLERCALRADRRLGGHSLLTTALEVLRDPAGERGAAATALLGRAAAQSAEWLPRLPDLREPAPVAGLAAALVPVFAGLVLLQATPATRTVPHGHPDASASRDARTAGHDTAPLAGTGDPNGTRVDLDALRESLRAPSPVPAASPKNARAPARLLSGDALPPADARVAALDPAGPRPPGRAGASGGAGHEPGSAQRSVQAPPRGSGNATLPPARRVAVAVAVPRTGDATAVSTASDRRFGDGPQAGPPIRAVQPAAAPPAADGWTTLTAAEVAYARRYLDAVRDARD